MNESLELMAEPEDFTNGFEIDPSSMKVSMDLANACDFVIGLAACEMLPANEIQMHMVITRRGVEMAEDIERMCQQFYLGAGIPPRLLIKE